MSFRLRLVLVLLALPQLLLGPALYWVPLASRLLGWDTLSPADPWGAVLGALLVLQGAVWVIALATRGRAWLVAAIAPAIALAWVGTGPVLAARAFTALSAFSLEAGVLAAASSLHPVLAWSALLLAALALRARVVTTVGAGVLPALQVVQIAATVELTRMTWGVAWIGDIRSVLLLLFHGALVLVAVAAVLRVWLESRPADQ